MTSEREHKRRLQTCKHFSGVWGPGLKPGTCRAGVAYREHVGGEAFGWVQGLPCLPRDEIKRAAVREVVPCALLEYPSEEEVIAEVEAIELCAKHVLRAIVLCAQDAVYIKEGSGIIDCPACGSKLRYHVYDKKVVRGSCETAGCVSWTA